jgi:hypothetical protein
LNADDDKTIYEKFVYLCLLCSTQRRRRKRENQGLRPSLKRDYVLNDVYPGEMGEVYEKCGGWRLDLNSERLRSGQI